MATTIERPVAGEYAPFYQRYIDFVQGEDILARLTRQKDELRALLLPLSAEKARYRYEEGKWSVTEIAGHLSDAERIFSYRALRIARGDATPLAGFDENTYTPAGRFDRRGMKDVLDEYASVRDATLAFVRSLEAEDLMRRGVANEQPISVRAILYIVAGHELHHRSVLVERYGVSA
jgi:uncharacterized damage-inducible protein DinB